MSVNSKREYPALETGRLKLRTLTLEDAEAVWRHFADEAVTRFMDIAPCRDIQEAEAISASILRMRAADGAYGIKLRKL